jgi:predicted outer membrane repeat protein
MYNGNDSNPTVISCTFDGNSAGDHGGGGMYNSFSSPTVINCTFSSNFGGLVNGGGGMLNNSSDPTVSNCTFSGNVALFTGGGMYSLNSNPTVTDCAFSDNFAIDGSGMYNFLSSPTVTDCRFSGNIAGGDGGGIYSSAGDPIVTNCTFSGNTSGSLGGGMANIGGSPTVANCTFIDNVAVFNGGGMFNIINSPTVTNCILWGNSPEEISGGTPTVTYSDVQGGFPGTGNIDADPLFVDPANNDLRLSPDSPCIDAADNTTPDLAGITTDLDGNPRFLDVPETPDTGNGELPIVDMGAYEALGGGCLAVTSQDIVCHADGSTFTVNIEGLNACTGGTTMVSFTGSGGAAGEEACFTVLVSDGGFCCSTEICVTVPDCSPDCDVNGDGVVGILDYLALLDTWGVCSDCGTPTSCPADFNHDCEVSSTDFLILLANWG